MICLYICLYYRSRLIALHEHSLGDGIPCDDPSASTSSSIYEKKNCIVDLGIIPVKQTLFILCKYILCSLVF